MRNTWLSIKRNTDTETQRVRIGGVVHVYLHLHLVTVILPTNPFPYLIFSIFAHSIVQYRAPLMSFLCIRAAGILGLASVSSRMAITVLQELSERMRNR